MTHERMNDDLLAKLVGRMPYEEAPVNLVDDVMNSLPESKPNPWKRFAMWLRTPLRISITPGRAIPVLAVSLLFAVVAVLGWGPADVKEGNDLIPVRFILGDQPKAHEVMVIGSFNHWREDGVRMHYDEMLGAWVADLRLPPGVHEYVFLLDGKRVVSDPAAPLSRDDGFGNRNSVLYLTGDHEQTL